MFAAALGGFNGRFRLLRVAFASFYLGLSRIRIALGHLRIHPDRQQTRKGKYWWDVMVAQPSF